MIVTAEFSSTKYNLIIITTKKSKGKSDPGHERERLPGERESTAAPPRRSVSHARPHVHTRICTTPSAASGGVGTRGGRKITDTRSSKKN